MAMMEVNQGLESAYCSGEDCFSDSSENGPNLVDDQETRRSFHDVDVAVIGNGPSAIFLSLLLSGYIPYFTGTLANNTPLKMKMDKNKEKPLIEQDFQYLSEGLEGRSNNPVALLFDSLFHPDADVGEEQPSALKWSPPVKTTKKCSHIVLGEQKPGGQWHIMNKSILTLSLKNWLELPMYTFDNWKQETGGIKSEECVPDFYPPKKYVNMRATTGDVAKYYSDYVEKMGLSDNFKSGLRVEKVEMKKKLCRWAEAVNASGRTTDKMKCKKRKMLSEDKGVVCPLIDECHRWVIKSKKISSDGNDEDPDEVLVQAKNLVLAGGLGSPLKLGIPGEDLEYILTSQSFQNKVKDIKQNGGCVLVVGAGMSGSDLILQCLKEGIPCYHVFKEEPNDPNLMISRMESGLYQEYHHLSTLMRAVKSSNLYTPFSQHTVLEFKEDGVCLLRNLRDNTTVTINVSYAVVMIGYSADLDYLPDEIKTHILSDPTQPVHNKKNPLDVDLYSFRSDIFPNLYAIGPLTGDNFVRFVFGSGLGSAQAILGYNKMN